MTERDDLAAMIGPIGKALLAMELPVLHAHGLSMWAYSVLYGLAGRSVRTQVALADAIGADKTRIISTLDDLQRRGLISREPDPDDRRRRVLSLTAAGERLRAAVQADIQRQEERVLARLPDEDRAALLRSLPVLAALPERAFTRQAE